MARSYKLESGGRTMKTLVRCEECGECKVVIEHEIRYPLEEGRKSFRANVEKILDEEGWYDVYEGGVICPVCAESIIDTDRPENKKNIHKKDKK